MFALAALAMTNTSCSDELENGGINANEAAVTFTVQLENNVGSRAIGDGTTAKNLYFAVYKAETGKIGDEVEALRQRVDVQPDLTATINTRLVKGQTYNFVFWAQTEQMTVDQSLAGAGTYYNLKDMSSIKVNYGEDNAYPNVKVTPANNEERDAFYARRNDLKITGPINETIILKRPFAQVNVGTLVGSLAEATTAEVNIANSEITFSEVATEFHPYDGTVGEETTDVKITYTSNAIPESNVTDTEGDLKNVADKNYEYLSMNYILVADRAIDGTNPENGERKAIIPNATFEIFDEAGTSINTFEIPNLPVQRNWRTNIIGDILSSNVTFNIIIDPDFNDDHNYFTEKELAYAALNGGEVTLEEDVVLDNYLDVKGNMIVNLNGHTISATNTNFDNETCLAFYVEDGAKLTINGDGNVKAMAGSAYDMAVWAVGGEVTINGGTFENLGATDKGCDVIYGKFGAVVNIYGGTFKAGNANKESFADKTNGVYAALNLHGSATGSINVYGGSFYKFNPVQPGTEGATWNDSHTNGFVADGYKVTQVGDYYYVTKEDVTAAANATGLASALATAGEVAMVEDVTIASTVTIADGATLDGQGNTVTMTKNNTQTALAPSKGGTIKNLNIEGYNTRNEAGNVIRGILETNITGDLVLDNVNISGVAYPINIQAKDFVPTSSLTVKGSTLVGWTSYTGLTSASFTDCTFGVGTYFDATVAGQETWNGCIKPYVTSTFTGCEFGEGFVLDLSALKADATLTFENCTVNGVALTALSQLGVTGSDTRVTIK